MTVEILGNKAEIPRRSPDYEQLSDRIDEKRKYSHGHINVYVFRPDELWTEKSWDYGYKTGQSRDCRH